MPTSLKRLLLVLALLTFSAPLFAAVPSDIAGLQFWYKGDAGTSCTINGCTLTAWNDQSSNADHLNAACGAQAMPTYDSTTTLNGKPSVNFGSSACGKFATTVNLQAALTVFVVVKNVDTASKHTFLSGLSNSLAYYSASATKQNGADKAGIALLGTGSANSDTSWHQQNVTYDGTNIFFRLDSATDGNAAPAVAITLDVATLGRNESNASEYFNGNIAEIFAYNAVLSAGNIAAMETYLCGRYPSLNGCVAATAGSSIVGKTTIVGGTVIH